MWLRRCKSRINCCCSFLFSMSSMTEYPWLMRTLISTIRRWAAEQPNFIVCGSREVNIFVWALLSLLFRDGWSRSTRSAPRIWTWSWRSVASLFFPCWPVDSWRMRIMEIYRIYEADSSSFRKCCWTNFLVFSHWFWIWAMRRLLIWVSATFCRLWAGCSWERWRRGTSVSKSAGC